MDSFDVFLLVAFLAPVLIVLVPVLLGTRGWRRLAGIGAAAGACCWGAIGALFAMTPHMSLSAFPIVLGAGLLAGALVGLLTAGITRLVTGRQHPASAA
jgi:hypothetical protein